MRYAPASLFVLLLLAPVAVGDEPGLRNPGFEQGAVGQAPPGWFVPVPIRREGFSLVVSDADPREGKTCGLLQHEGPNAPKTIGNLMQSIDAGPYRGKRVRLSASIRVAGARRAQMWMRVDLEGGGRGFFDNMGDRPIQSSSWTEAVIEGEVAENASSIAVGCLMSGRGRVYVDAFSLEVAGAALPPFEPEGGRALRGRALDNVVAFARLYGYVRFFHASDEAAGADWNRLAIAGVRAIEPAKNPRELAETLQAFFAPVAPTLVVHPRSRRVRDVPGAERPEGEGPYTVRRWEHRGFGQPDSIYSSVRHQEPLSGNPLPEPFRADLGGGVACVLPLAVYADDQGTLPRAIGTPAAEPPENHRASGDDRATRLADVVIAWNVFQHFYPYFDVVETNWSKELERALTAAAEDEDERAFLDTLRRMVAALHDGHGNVFHASDDRSRRLPLLWAWIEGELVVTHVGKPLEGVLAPGDVVETIDGVKADKALDAVESLISGATSQWRRYRGLMDLARRRTTDPVTLGIRTFDGDARRKVEAVPSGVADTPSETRPEEIAEVEEGVFYVDLGRIDDEAFRKALPELARAKGVVFDMRGYPSHLNFNTWFPHLVKESSTSAQWRVPLVTRPDREDMTCPRGAGWRIEPEAPYLEGKRAFLLDGRAISYAESCMGIVEHYRLGEIVGGPSAGTNGNVNPFTLPGGYRVMWTGMQVLKHDGSQHHGVGILPTIPVERTRAGVAAGRDEILDRAVAAVR